MSMDFNRMAAQMDDMLKSYEESQNKAERYRGYASKLIEARNELDAANEKCLRLQADCERFARVNDSLIVENEDLKKKLDQAGDLWKGIIYELQTEVNQLKAENARLSQELAEERKQHSNTAAAAEDFSCELDQLRTELADRKKAVIHFQELWHNAERRADAYSPKMEVLAAENLQLEAERDQLRAEVKRDERIYNTIMDLLEQDGYDTMSLFFNTGYIVAQMELEEEHDRR